LIRKAKGRLQPGSAHWAVFSNHSLFPAGLSLYAGLAAIFIMTKSTVIPAWMPESSATDGNLETSQELDLA
jgi:hypothetical protein